MFNTEHLFPRLTINLFAKSNGMIVKVGDRSDSSAIEVIVGYPDWAEGNERFFQEIKDALISNNASRINNQVRECIL